MKYEYYAVVKKVIDGDTLDVTIDLGFELSCVTRIRLLGIDTPEVYGTRASEEGKKVKQYVIDLLAGKQLVVKTVKDRTEKYGRYLAEVFYQVDITKTWPEGYVSLNKELLEKGMAKPYE